MPAPTNYTGEPCERQARISYAATRIPDPRRGRLAVRPPACPARAGNSAQPIMIIQ
ncbi:hypothetical protein AZ20_2691 [Bordetella bronchiseptica E014]|nr:hypothetical protein AZ20_2691 [Bordetella bronchiseptica E014]